jgi:glycosyltransferase involved in cell wall biosynthesis
MDGVTVIIPSRNEKYLEPTIRNVLENARGEIEVLAILDGWIPDPPIHINDDRMRFIPLEESIGQRQSINLAAKQAKGKYIMKLDAHCAVDEGFDVKLIADCEYDWTVIPRMYNLDIETFKPKLHKRTDYMYMRVRENGQFRAEYYTGKEYRRLHKIEKELDDTMCCMGPCFFMFRDRFLELGGCDENHGGWGSQGIEVSCKAWLSGGRLVVNKKTWFSHWFRGGGGPGFPYKLSGKQVQHARNYAKDLWIGNKWPKATRKFEWMMEKFNPPGWKEEDYKMKKPGIYRPRNAKSHIYGRPMRVDTVVKNIDHYWDYRKKSRAEQYGKVIQFFADLHHGKVFETDKELQEHPYYEYVKSGFKTNSEKTWLNIMKDSVGLYHDVKANGLKNPIDMWIHNGKLNLSRGSRRLAIQYILGKKWVACRVYKNEDLMEKLRAAEVGTFGPISDAAQKQFQKWGWKATDKYWVHSYTLLYDEHCSYLRDEKAKILEVGVQRGPSLRVWQEAFPKAKIYGVDLDIGMAKLAKDTERITLLEGSQTDDKFNKETVIPLGPFDLIIDDASHLPEQQKKGFDLLWGSVKPGGWYIVEDVYSRNYRNNRKESADTNMMAKLSKLVDHMQDQCDIECMYFYYNIVFVKKRHK